MDLRILVVTAVALSAVALWKPGYASGQATEPCGDDLEGLTTYVPRAAHAGTPLAVGVEHDGSGPAAVSTVSAEDAGHALAVTSTDELGFAAAENPVSVHDLHATILHLMGLDHERLTYRYSGRDFRLTDVEGNVVREVLA